MLIQIKKDFLINMDQVNYVKEFTDLGDGKKKTYVRFIDKDSVCLPIPLEEFIDTAKKLTRGGEFN